MEQRHSATICALTLATVAGSLTACFDGEVRVGAQQMKARVVKAAFCVGATHATVGVVMRYGWENWRDSMRPRSAIADQLYLLRTPIPRPSGGGIAAAPCEGFAFFLSAPGVGRGLPVRGILTGDLSEQKGHVALELEVMERPGAPPSDGPRVRIALPSVSLSNRPREVIEMLQTQDARTEPALASWVKEAEAALGRKQ